MYALKQKVDSIMAEGLEARFARHAKLNDMIHQWAEKHGFKNFAPEGFQSKTLTALDNQDGKLDVAGFIKALRAKHNVLINGGYGKIKGITFRISNMGNETEQSIQELIDQLDDVIVDFK
jgi:aspartate aminotransferase-like enzyme